MEVRNTPEEYSLMTNLRENHKNEDYSKTK